MFNKIMIKHVIQKCKNIQVPLKEVASKQLGHPV